MLFRWMDRQNTSPGYEPAAGRIALGLFQWLMVRLFAGYAVEY